MLTIKGLNYTIDSLANIRQSDHETFSKTLYNRSSISNLDKEKKESNKDSIYTGDILDIFETKNKTQLIDIASNTINSTKQIINSKEKTLKISTILFNRHIIALHEKLALGFACIILFFVGAPLGALIRKGGLGLPMVIAILLFLTYHFIGIFATNSSKDGSLNPAIAPWFSTIIMFPLGIFLTRRATADRGLFETEGLLEPLKKLFRLKKKPSDEDTTLFIPSSSEYSTLNSFDNNRLIDIIKNYRQYDYTVIYKNTALSILNLRGITNQQLKFGGHFSNQKFEDTLLLNNKYEEDSKLAFVLYTIALILIVTGRILENNNFPLIGNILFAVGIIAEIIYLFSLMKSFSSHSNLNKHLGKETFINALIFSLIGLPLYFIVYFYQKKKIDKDLNLNN